MEQVAAKTDIIAQLQQQILSLQGFKVMPGNHHIHAGLSPIESAFPGGILPVGAVHELISYHSTNAAATNAFIAALAGNIMQQGICLWIGTKNTIFPAALKQFGIAPERVIFLSPASNKEALWAMEEALRCEAVAAVIGELPELSFTQSRRLQLAVEKSHCCGFIHRHKPKTENTTACVTRWKVSILPGIADDGMPGLGDSRWQVELCRVRNGRPGRWVVDWSAGCFRCIDLQHTETQKFVHLKAS